MKMTQAGRVIITPNGIETHDFEWNVDDETQGPGIVIELVPMQVQALKWAQGILEDKLRELTLK